MDYKTYVIFETKLHAFTIIGEKTLYVFFLQPIIWLSFPEFYISHKWSSNPKNDKSFLIVSIIFNLIYFIYISIIIQLLSTTFVYIHNFITLYKRKKAVCYPYIYRYMILTIVIVSHMYCNTAKSPYGKKIMLEKTILLEKQRTWFGLSLNCDFINSHNMRISLFVL